MTGKTSIRISVYAAAAVAALAFLFYMRSDAVGIRRTLDAVSELAGKVPGETVMEGAVRARKISAYLADSCRCILPEHGVNAAVSRENAAGAVLAFRNDLAGLRITFGEPEISSGNGFALVSGTVRIDGSPAAGKFPLPCVMTFKAEMKEVDGIWVFARFEGAENAEERGGDE